MIWAYEELLNPDIQNMVSHHVVTPLGLSNFKYDTKKFCICICVSAKQVSGLR